MRTLVLLFFSVLVVGQDKSSDPLPPPLPSSQIESITGDVLLALNEFEMSTLRDPAADQEPSMVLEMKSLMDQSAALRRGMIITKKYMSNKNEIVQVIGKGATGGAAMIIKANDDILAIARKPNVRLSDYNFQLAEAASKKDEGYQLIFKSVCWTSALMYRFSDDQVKHGPIPYNLTKAERQQLIKQIDNMFGKDIAEDEEQRKKTHTVNWMIQAAKYLRDQITADTYEELAVSENQSGAN